MGRWRAPANMGERWRCVRVHTATWHAEHVDDGCREGRSIKRQRRVPPILKATRQAECAQAGHALVAQRRDVVTKGRVATHGVTKRPASTQYGPRELRLSTESGGRSHCRAQEGA